MNDFKNNYNQLIKIKNKIQKENKTDFNDFNYFYFCAKNILQYFLNNHVCWNETIKEIKEIIDLFNKLKFNFKYFDYQKIYELNQLIDEIQENFLILDYEPKN